MHEAKSQLSRLVELATAGEEVILARHGDPVARIVSYQAAPAPRQFGMSRGVFTVSEDFNAPMSDAELDEFLGTGAL